MLFLLLLLLLLLLPVAIAVAVVGVVVTIVVVTIVVVVVVKVDCRKNSKYSYSRVAVLLKTLIWFKRLAEFFEIPLLMVQGVCTRLILLIFISTVIGYRVCYYFGPCFYVTYLYVSTSFS